MFGVGQRVLLRRMFGQFLIKGIQIEEPVTIIVNHSNFYDSLILFELQKRGILPKNTLAIITREGMEKVPLFKSIGVLPVSEPMKLSEYKNIVRAMKTKNLVIFPQGKEVHQEKRPIQIQNGLAALLDRNEQHGLMFVTMYYSFGSGIRGEVVCRMDYLPAVNRPKKELHSFIQVTMEQQLDIVKEDVINGQLNDYEKLW